MSYHWNWGIFLQPVSTGEPSTYLGWLLSGMANTVAVSLAGWILALLVGVCMGILRTLPDRRLAAIGTAYVVVFRNIPLIVQFFLWYIVLPEMLPKAAGDWFKSLPPLLQFYSTSIVCLGLFTAARVCEQVRAGLNALPKGQKAAGLAIGLSLPQVYRYILLPVGFRIIVPPITSEFLNIFKNSAVASTIGLLELSAQARQLVDFTAQAYESFIAVTIAYGLINLSVMYLMRWLENKTSLPGMMGVK
jgi:glutamate/aspartate transport system permease protein